MEHEIVNLKVDYKIEPHVRVLSAKKLRVNLMNCKISSSLGPVCRHEN